VISTAELLTNFEHCNRWGYWSRSWERHRLTPMDMFHEAVRTALVEDTPDPGEAAGENFMMLARDRGLEISDSINLYRCAKNHSAIADIVTTAIRRNGEDAYWTSPESPEGWTTSALMNPEGTRIRQFLAVSTWSEDREFYEKHSWFCLGEIAHWRMPMELVVAVLGPMSGGRRTGPWSKAQIHPQRSELRFRIRRRRSTEGFRDTWLPVYREDHDEIGRDKWLAAMLVDEVLQQSLFVVPVPVPEEPRLTQIRDLAARQLQRLDDILPGKLYTGPPHVPEKQLSTCHNPIAPCPFRACCWSDPESLPEAGGYDSISRSSMAAGPSPHGTHSLRE
jgi:hypothetical protein